MALLFVGSVPAWRRRGPQPQFVYYAVVYGVGPVATGVYQLL